MEGTLYDLGGKDLNANAQVTTVQTLSIQTPAEDFQRHDHAMKFGSTLKKLSTIYKSAIETL